jgi:membrane protease YdiL (CAAX protease family)
VSGGAGFFVPGRKNVGGKPIDSKDRCAPRQDDAALLHDAWFWTALLLGPAAAIAIAFVVQGEVQIRIGAEQWRRLLWLVLLYPVIEEWLFRGQLQPRLLRTCFGRRVRLCISGANLLTSLLFAMMHLVTHPPLWALAVIVPSLIFGLFRERYGSILPGVLLHCSYNLAYFALFGLSSS